MANDSRNDPKNTEAPVTRAELMELMKALSAQNQEAIKAQGDQMVAVLAATLKAQAVTREGFAAQANTNAKEALEAAQAKLETCPECHQKRFACKDKHRKVEILPKTKRDARYFQGALLNGVKYLSTWRGQLVTIPEDFCPEAIVQGFEEAEERMRNGYENLYDSGSIGKGGTGAHIHYPGFRQ